MSVPIDRDETGRSKQPYALNRARGAHRAGETAGATTRRDGSRGTSTIAREDKRSRHSRVEERRTILAVRSCLCQGSARLDARRRAERSLPWYGRRARESSRRFGRSTLARESSSVGRQPNAAHPRGDLWVSVARATSTRARAGRSRQQTGDLRVHTRGTLFQDWTSYECVIFGGGAPPAGEFFFSPPAMGLSSSGESPGWGVSCVFRGAVRHTRRARGSSRTHRVVSTEVLASGLRFPSASTRETSAHRHDASARGRRSRFRRRRQRIRRWSLAGRQRGIRRPRWPRRPRRLRRRTSGYRRRCVTSEPHASSRASPRAREPNANTPRIVGLP